MKLRPYQQAALDALIAYFRTQRGNPVVVMPTGTGKSLVIAAFLAYACRTFPSTRALVLTHSKTLVEQDYNTFCRYWPLAPAGIYCDGLNRKELGAPVTFGTIGSMINVVAHLGRINLLLIDEAHMVSPKEQTMYRRLILALTMANPMLKVVGFTATPFRLGQGMIIEEGGIFTDVAYDLSTLEAFNQLLADGYLCPLVPPSDISTRLDVSQLHMTGGDYNQRELAEAEEMIMRAALEEMVNLGHDRNHWLIFVSGVANCEKARNMLNEMDVSAVAIHSKLKADEEARAMKSFLSGRARAAVNNNVLTTGFDFPGIDLIGVLRATASPGLWVQMLGRGTRPVYAPGWDLDSVPGRLSAIAASEKPNCLVLDFARNTERLGPINCPVVPRAKGAKKPGDAPFKICPKCGVYTYASAKFCINCAYEFPFQIKLEDQAATLELIKKQNAAVQDYKIATVTVRNVDYAKHSPTDGRPPMLKVTYGCGLRKFKEYICFEHNGYAYLQAKTWWTNRNKNGTPPPETVDKALEHVIELRQPFALEVHDKPKLPDILRAHFISEIDGKPLCF